MARKMFKSSIVIVDRAISKLRDFGSQQMHFSCDGQSAFVLMGENSTVATRITVIVSSKC